MARGVAADAGLLKTLRNCDLRHAHRAKLHRSIYPFALHNGHLSSVGKAEHGRFHDYKAPP
jgi:hypothetical protein